MGGAARGFLLRPTARPYRLRRKIFSPPPGAAFGLFARLPDKDDRAHGLAVASLGNPGYPVRAMSFTLNLEFL